MPPQVIVLCVLGGCVGVLFLFGVVGAARAVAAIGYEPDPSQPVVSLGGEYPHGIAVDQENGRIYVAVLSADFAEKTDGLVDQLESDGVGTANSPFTGGSDAFFAGVAVNPLTGGIYASQAAAPVGGGYIGETRMDLFSSTGAAGGSFALTTSHRVAPQIAVDSAGDVFYPNDATGTVQVFSAAGVLEREISCGSCVGGRFVTPAGVAVDGVGDLYVVDLGSDRVVELAPSGGGGAYVYVATVQSGEGAVAVGVDRGLGVVFVGDVSAGGGYHIVAYEADGAQFDDFGAGLFARVEYSGIAWQIAANEVTHLLYATDEGKILVFHRAMIRAPVLSSAAPSSVGQVTATLNATVNAEGHAVLGCEFQYAQAADSSYTDAGTAPCSVLPSGISGAVVSAKLKSLLPSTSYRYRVVAENNGGSTTGGEETFETLPALPATVSAAGALEVAQTSATLTAEVNPNGASISGCEFEYGPTVSYGASVACERLPEPASIDVTEAARLSGLTAGTSYDYRLDVTASSGATDGENAQFTTLAQPPAASSQSTTSTDPPPQPPPAASGQSTSSPAASAPQPDDKRSAAPRRCPAGASRTTADGSAGCLCRRGFRSSKRHGKLRCTKKNTKKKKRKEPGRRSRSNPLLAFQLPLFS